MKTSNFEEITHKKPKMYNKNLKSQKEAIAFDTETLNGKMFLMGVSDENYTTLLQNGLKNPENMSLSSHICETLEKLYSYKDTLNVFYNLEYDDNAIISNLPEKYLNWYTKYNYVIYEGWYISGIPRKSIDLAPCIEVLDVIYNKETESYTINTKGENKEVQKRPVLYFDIENRKYIIGRKVKFFDLWQFFKFEPISSSLDNVSKKYLNDNKTPMEELGYDKGCLPIDKTVIEYCIKDCKLTQELCSMIIKACNDIGLLFNAPYSCATISADYFFDIQKIKNPYMFLWQYGYNMSRKNLDIFRYAFYAYKGGRTEVTKRGNYDNVFENDVCSMYPSNMLKLYDIFEVEWVKINHEKELNAFDKTNIAYGFFRCNIKLNNNYVNPLPYNNNGYYIYGYGNFENYYLIMEEIDQIRNLELGEVKIIEGYIGLKTIKNAYCFKETIESLYTNRKKYPKTDFRNPLMKIILNSIYGRFIEVNCNKGHDTDDIDLMNDDYDFLDDDVIKKSYSAGKYFCPVYAAYITGLSRVKLFDAIYPIKETFIASFTDSIFSTEQPKIKIGEQLGEWENDKGELTILGSGVYRMEYYNKKEKLRTRGYHIKETALGVNYFGLNGMSLDELIVNGCDTTKVKKLKESVIQEKIEEFNTFIEEHKDLNLNFDKKRLWNISFKNLNDCYKQCNSEMININNETILKGIRKNPIIPLHEGTKNILH